MTYQEVDNMMKRPIVGAAIAAATIIGLGGTAFAGEVNGNGDPTPVQSYRAASICSFSGLEDGLTLIGFGPDGPIFIEVDTGPGLVQNPHMENAAGIIHPAGVAGDECRGGGPPER